jgi:tetrathionate reductase subunit B
MESENNKKKTRRDFLIATTAIAGGLVALPMLKPFGAFSKEADSSKTADAAKKIKAVGKTDRYYGFGFDIEKCIGCGKCAVACKTENDVSTEPFYFRTWVEQYVITNDDKVKIASPNGGIDAQKQLVPDSDVFKSFFVPKTCNQCAKSPCDQVCPVGATFTSPDGVVMVDSSYCIGCGYCVQACPYGCRYIKPDTHTVDKCNLCYHRITKDMPPACVEVCPTGARMYGDLHDKSGPLVAFIKEHNTRVLKPNLNTKPKLFYNALAEEVR